MSNGLCARYTNEFFRGEKNVFVMCSPLVEQYFNKLFQLHFLHGTITKLLFFGLSFVVSFMLYLSSKH